MFSGGLQSIGSQKVKHNWSDWEHSTVYNKIILEINYVKVSINTTNSWKLYNTLLSKYLAKKKKKSSMNWMRIKAQHIKICEMLPKKYSKV